MFSFEFCSLRSLLAIASHANVFWASCWKEFSSALNPDRSQYWCPAVFMELTRNRRKFGVRHSSVSIWNRGCTECWIFVVTDSLRQNFLSAVMDQSVAIVGMMERCMPLFCPKRSDANETKDERKRKKKKVTLVSSQSSSLWNWLRSRRGVCRLKQWKEISLGMQLKVVSRTN